jgi:hypothetical protein
MTAFMRWLAAASVCSILFCAATLGTFVPLRDDIGIQYLYAWPGAQTLIAGALAAGVALLALFVAIVYVARRHGAEDRARAALVGRWLMPVALVGLVVVGLAPALCLERPSGAGSQR